MRALGRLIAGVSAGLAVGGCHRTPVRSPDAAPELGRAIGNASVPGARITYVRRLGGPAVTFDLAAPAHVAFLVVTPGVGVRALTPRTDQESRFYSAGRHTVRVPWPAASPTATTVVRRGDYEAEYQRCLQRAAAEYGRATGSTTTTNTNRPPGDTGRGAATRPSPPSTSAEARRHAEATCRARRPQAAAPPSVLRPESYVVLLAAPGIIHGERLAQKLQTLAVTATDVHATLESIGSHLLADLGEAWWGYYVRW